MMYYHIICCPITEISIIAQKATAEKYGDHTKKYQTKFTKQILIKIIEAFSIHQQIYHANTIVLC